MTINLTLFVQIIHFFIAYWILKRFFFTPALRELGFHEAGLQHDMTLLMLERKRVECIQEVYIKLCKQRHVMLRASIPQLSEYHEEEPASVDVRDTMADVQRQELVQEVTAALVESIGGDDVL